GALVILVLTEVARGVGHAGVLFLLVIEDPGALLLFVVEDAGPLVLLVIEGAGPRIHPAWDVAAHVGVVSGDAGKVEPLLEGHEAGRLVIVLLILEERAGWSIGFRRRHHLLRPGGLSAALRGGALRHGGEDGGRAEGLPRLGR